MARVASSESSTKSSAIVGVSIPDSKLAQEITELVRDTETALLFNHSSRVYYWGALTGKRRGLRFDPELLYAGAMFHDMGLTPSMRARMSVSRSRAPMLPVISSAATACRARTRGPRAPAPRPLQGRDYPGLL